MENIKIEEIANELGMQSKELIKRVQLLYNGIQSPKSTVTQEEAQEIFDLIVFDKKALRASYFHASPDKNINLFFSPDKIDVTMLEKIASTYKQARQKEFMIRSFNFSELSIVKILTAGLINLDIKKYVTLKSTHKELSQLLENMNKIVDDVDFEALDNKNPLNDFKKQIENYKPEIVYIEGIDYHNYIKHKEVFGLIQKFAKTGILFKLGFSGINSDDTAQEIMQGFAA
jgi:hypothetical protein